MLHVWERCKKAYKILAGKPDRSRSLGRLRHRWKDNIKTGLQQIRYQYAVWIHYSSTGITGRLL
jgi:hypothetical protein